MKVVHDWLKDYLGDAAPTPEAVEELLTFHSFEIDAMEAVGTDTVIDVKILPNRGADCLSHRGIAREIAALIDKPLAHDPLASVPEMPVTERLKITINDTHACRHFDLALIEGVSVKESPEWLKRRLVALGQRSINNVVDATNYVMLSLGQPTHVYAAEKFKQEGDVWHFAVRMAKTGEKIVTLGGQESELDETIQVITNAADGALAGIAGVKGGAYAELDANTTTLILEAGNFDPAITRKAAQKLRLQTDASKRFENGVSTKVVPYALAELVRLILEIAGGELIGYAHQRPVDIDNQAVVVSLAKINSVLGLTLTAFEVEDICRRLGFVVENTGEGSWNVTAPLERTDIVIEEDVIEEVGRLHGYEKVASVLPISVPLTEYNSRHYYSELIRATLVGLGFSEVITSSFRKKDEIQLQNALASDKSYLRSKLIANVTEALDKNAGFVDLLGTTDTRIFEIGTVFNKSAEGIGEHVSLCLGARLKPSGYSGKEDKVLQETLTALSAKLNIPLDAHIEKGVAELNLTALLTALPAVTAYQTVPSSPETVYRPFSMYPSVSRDIALWVSEGTTASEIEAVLNEHAGELRVRTTLFDEFTKDGRTSFAFRLVFQSFAKTLTDEEVNGQMTNIYAAVAARGWEVR